MHFSWWFLVFYGELRRTSHTGHCWRSRDELISDVLLWTRTYGRAKAGWPAWTFIQQLCEDTGCSPEDLPEAMNDREKWWERVRDICSSGTTWWWFIWLWFLGEAFFFFFFFFFLCFFNERKLKLFLGMNWTKWSTLSITVIVAGNGIIDLSSNSKRICLHFTWLPFEWESLSSTTQGK